MDNGNRADLGKTMAIDTGCLASQSQEQVVSLSHSTRLGALERASNFAPVSSLAFPFIPIQEHYFRV